MSIRAEQPSPVSLRHAASAIPPACVLMLSNPFSRFRLPQQCRSIRGDRDNELKLNDSAAHADCYCLSAIIGAQLAQDVLEMNLDGFLCDEQGFCDIPVPVAGSNMTENIHFTSAEIFVAHVFCKSGGNFWRNALVASVNSTNGVNHLLWGNALQQVPVSSSSQGPLNVHIAFVCRQYNGSGLGKFCPDRNHDLYAIEVRQPEVHESNVWSQSAECFDRFGAVRRRPHQQHVGLSVDHCGDPLSKQRVVFHAQDSYARNTCHNLLLVTELLP